MTYYENKLSECIDSLENNYGWFSKPCDFGDILYFTLNNDIESEMKEYELNPKIAVRKIAIAIINKWLSKYNQKVDENMLMGRKNTLYIDKITDQLDKNNQKEKQEEKQEEEDPIILNFKTTIEESNLKLLQLSDEVISSVKNGDFHIFSGLRYTIDPKIPSSVELDEFNMFVRVASSRRVIGAEVELNGKWQPVDPSASYTLGGLNYTLVNGGSSGMFSAAQPVDCDLIKDTEIPASVGRCHSVVLC